jgi:hypothetical protein
MSTFAPLPAGIQDVGRALVVIPRCRFHRAGNPNKGVLPAQLISGPIDPFVAKMHVKDRGIVAGELIGKQFLKWERQDVEGYYGGGEPELSVKLSVMGEQPVRNPLGHHGDYDRILVHYSSTLDTGLVSAIEFTEGTLEDRPYSQAALLEAFEIGAQHYCVTEVSVGTVMPPISVQRISKHEYRVGTVETLDGLQEITAILFGSVRGQVRFAFPRMWGLTDTINRLLTRTQAPFVFVEPPLPGTPYYAWRLLQAENTEGERINGMSLHTLSVDALFKAGVRLSPLEISRAIY